MARLEVRNPVAQVSAWGSALSPRLPTLNHKRIGLYWNGKSGGDVALNRIGQLLEGKLQGVKFELIRSAVPGPKALVDYAKSFDAIIGSTGD